MDVNIDKNNSLQNDNFVVDFEVEKTPVRLGKSDRYFYMDFNDTNFPVRLKEGREEIASYLEEKKNFLGLEKTNDVDTDNIGIDEAEKIIQATKEIDQFIKSKLNYIFGYDISEDIFGVVSSTSVTRDGSFYFDSFLNALLPLIEKEYKVRLNSVNNRVKKYTDRKGLHPALKK